MKPIFIFSLVIALAACSDKDGPTGHIYRYPPNAEPPAIEPASRNAGGVVVDFHNHALPEPEEGQHWELQPGSFLLVDAAGRVLSAVPARYAGR